jgi:hypothetical protein
MYHSVYITVDPLKCQVEASYVGQQWRTGLDSRAVSPTDRPSSPAMDRWIHCCSINDSRDTGSSLHVGPTRLAELVRAPHSKYISLTRTAEKHLTHALQLHTARVAAAAAPAAWWSWSGGKEEAVRWGLGS